MVSGVDGRTIENEILLDLPRKECGTVLANLEPFQFQPLDVLNEMRESIQYAYFLNSGLASFMIVMNDGKSVETGMSGKEGFIGTPLITGFKSGPTRVIAQVEGTGFRVPAKTLAEMMRNCPRLTRSLHQHCQLMSFHAAQIAACNRLHEVDERLARWLLMAQERIGSDVVPCTQEALAGILGTRRSSITAAVGVLQKAGLIASERGHVKIVDRKGLQKTACECYAVIEQQFHMMRQ